MEINNLWDRHKGEEIYIVGTGPSLRVFPKKILEDKVTIGLNNSWKFIHTQYCVTIHPEILRDYEENSPWDQSIDWVVKANKRPYKIPYRHPKYYVFDSDRPVSRRGFNLRYIRERINGRLYIGRGIQQTAMNLALHMGARAIFLVGVDMCQIGSDHHGIRQHVRFCGLPADEVYREYRLFTDHVRKVIQFEKGVPVLTLSPFIGLGSPDEDYERLCERMNLSPLPIPEDTSIKNNRKKISKPWKLDKKIEK